MGLNMVVFGEVGGGHQRGGRIYLILGRGMRVARRVWFKERVGRIVDDGESTSFWFNTRKWNEEIICHDMCEGCE
jgi:hypothetical protein